VCDNKNITEPRQQQQIDGEAMAQQQIAVAFA